MPDCKHFKDGVCRLFANGGRPSAGVTVCGGCDVPPAPPTSSRPLPRWEPPEGYDPAKGWMLDSKGTEGCGCA